MENNNPKSIKPGSSTNSYPEEEKNIHGEGIPNWQKTIGLFLVSQNVSLFGSAIVSYAIIWYITLETASGVWLMMATLCSMVPQVLISLFAGVWADRYNRKYLIMLADGFIALATLGLAITFFMGYGRLELLLIVAIIRSIGSGIQTPSVNALYAQIVPTANLTKVQGINQSLNSILLLIAPAVGGLILGSLGLYWALMVDVITASMAIIILCPLKIKKALNSESISMLEDLKEGINYALGHKLLRKILPTFAIAYFLVTPMAVLTPLLVERVFGSSVWYLTANEMAWTAGSFLGGLFVTWRGQFKDKIRTLAITLIAFGITFALLGVASNFIIYLIIMGISGAFVPLMVTSITVLLQENVEPEMMGRAFSLLQIVMTSAMPIAILLFGPLADQISITWILLVSGVLLIAVGLIFGRNSKDPGLFVHQKKQENSNASLN